MARYKWILLFFVSSFIIFPRIHIIQTGLYYKMCALSQVISRGPVTMTPLKEGRKKTVRASYGLPSAGVIYSIYI